MTLKFHTFLNNIKTNMDNEINNMIKHHYVFDDRVAGTYLKKKIIF